MCRICPQFKEARKSIIGAVLATDMAKHFHDIGRLKSRLEARQAGTPFSAADPLDRQVSESVFQTCVAFCSRVARVTVLLVHPLLTQSLTSHLPTYSPHRQMLLEMTLHAADLSGPVRPWEVSSVWAAKVSEEFDR